MSNGATTVDDTPRNSSAAVQDDMQKLKISSSSTSANNNSLVDRAEDIQISSNQSKLSAILGILRKLIGVTDVVNLRLSLPSRLLDPIPNLEYWNYMDRPEYFVAIPESDDDVERMLATLAWWFSKLLKHTDKVHKPFNSILGEQFFCHWNVKDSPKNMDGQGTTTSSVTDVSGSSDNDDSNSSDDLRVEYITEQVSHHPPVSAYVYRCKERGVEAAGLDHITAKFTGLSATVASGSQFKGLFITLASRDNEAYVCSQPTGNIVGWLRGNLKVQFVENNYIVCAKSKLATIIEFKEERWIGKNKDNVSGKVFRYDPETQGELIPKWKLKDIPKSCEVVATFGGNWDRQVNVKREGEKKERELIDLSSLEVAKKVVKPLEEQGELESRRVWGPVASKMIQGAFDDATKLKREIEDVQRAKAAQRKEKGEVFVPALFQPDYSESGKPELLDTAQLNL